MPEIAKRIQKLTTLFSDAELLTMTNESLWNLYLFLTQPVPAQYRKEHKKEIKQNIAA